ncbi:MAG: hypothetical protein MUP85_23070 [Candidatus Lokiarchaeota archaeon]|nr:hypothetical protein [Candidatus Lokiarchaeota archaeon]
MRCEICGNETDYNYGNKMGMICKDCAIGKIESKKSSSSDISNLRFNTLLNLGQIVSVFGWIVVSASLIFCIVGIVAFESLGAIVIISGVIALINGILVVAIGHLISCFVSIEANTYRTNYLLEQLIKKDF